MANALTQQLAWVEALRNTETRVLSHLTRHLPADHDLFAWFAFGELLATLHRELAGEWLTFADVARRGETLVAFRESACWHALADRFDDYGGIVAPAWQEAPIDLKDADIAMVDSPSDQADAVVRALACFNGAFAADDITIGVPDVRIVPYIQQRLAAYGLPLRSGAGTPVTSTSPCRLLRAVAAYLLTAARLPRLRISSGTRLLSNGLQRRGLPVTGSAHSTTTTIHICQPA